jgi:hypothetical protein
MKPNSKVKRKFSKPVKVKFYDGKHIDLLGKPNSPKPSPETISEIKKKFNNFLVKEEVIKKGSDWNERIYNLWNFFLPYLTAGKKGKKETFCQLCNKPISFDKLQQDGMCEDCL